jgi:hypothetical protein
MGSVGISLSMSIFGQFAPIPVQIEPRTLSKSLNPDILDSNLNAFNGLEQMIKGLSH